MSLAYIPSLDRNGKSFNISVYKPQGRPAYATASEGVLGDDGRSFTTILYGDDRNHRVLLIGNNSLKNRQVAVGRLLADLIDKGWIAADSSVVVS